MSALGMTTTVLATGLTEAYAKDEDEIKANHPDCGFDLSAGMFGAHVSAWLKEVAKAFVDSNNKKTGYDPLPTSKAKLEALMLACREDGHTPEYKDLVELRLLLERTS